MKHISTISLPRLKRVQKMRINARSEGLDQADLNESKVGVFSRFARRVSSLILGEQIRIQKSPNEFVNATEEYQNLQNQVGPNSFLRMH